MDYLALCQRLRQEVGASGTGPTAVTGQIGEYKRLCDYVAQAWTEIQQEHDSWNWMRKTFSFNTIANQEGYAPDAAPVSLTDHAAWDTDTFRLYTTSIGVDDEQHLTWMAYQAFRNLYQFGTQRVTYQRPIAFTIAPDERILLGNAPDAVYTVVGEYIKTPQTLAANTDIPELPTRFHMAIVYRAMMSYGHYEAATEVVARGDALYRDMLIRLELDQLQPMGLPGALY